MESYKDKIKKEAGFNKEDFSDDEEENESGDESNPDEEEEKNYEEMKIKNSELIVSFLYSLTFLQFYPESCQRSWLKKHGKKHCIDFDDEEREKLRGYFNSLDEDGSGKFSFWLFSEAIGVEELEDPLIALGLCENRD